MLGVAGRAYVFVRSGTTWTFETKIIASIAYTGIGVSVDISDDGSRIVSGNHASEVNTVVNAGAAYVYA